MRRALVVLLGVAAAALPARSQEERPAADLPPLDRAPELLAQVVPRVEAACGARFPAPPRTRLLDLRAAEAAYAEDLRSEYERRYPAATGAQRATLLRLDAARSVRSALGRYSFSRREILLVREAFDAQSAGLVSGAEETEALLASVLAHEAVHALDDARFDLARIYREAPDEEALRARAMVAEGRAVHFGRIAARAAGAPPRLADLLPGGDRPADERDWTLRLTYELGAEFVAALCARGGTGLADRALASPPARTWHVCDPSRWPDGRVDPRPAGVLSEAGLAAAARPLSDLQLLARYAAADGPDAARRLFAGHLGGAQALVEETNAAVLAFATEEDALRYAERGRSEAAVARRGLLVYRAAGPAQDAVLARLLR